MPLTTQQPTLQTQPWMGGTGAANSGSSDWTNLIGGVTGLFGAGLGAYNQQQNYDVLKNALSTIGPTQLNPWNTTGPGGVSTGYNPSTGSSNIDLGSLNSAFGGLTGAGTAGVGGYGAGINPLLTGSSLGTLSPALSTLNGAYGNYNAGMGAANTQLGSLGQTYSGVYNNTLNSLIQQQTPQLNQQAFGLQNTLFGKGVLDSTGGTSGAIAAGNFGSQVNAQLAQDRLTAQQQALGAQQAGVQNYGALSSSANNILSGALSNFGNTNQLISGLNTAGLNNSLQALQGAGALQTLGLNQYNTALQTGMSQAQARNMSLFPYASVATALSGTQNGLGAGANLLSSLGNSLAGNSGGLTGLLKSILGGGNNSNSLLNSLFGGSTGPMDSFTGTGSEAAGQQSLGSILGGDGGISADDALGASLTPTSAAAAPAATISADDALAASLAPTTTAADTGATAYGADLAGETAAADAAGAGGGGAGADAAATGSLGGSAAALGIGLSPLLLAATVPQGEGANYWSSLGNSLNTPINPNAQFGTGMAAGNTGLSVGQMNAINEVASGMADPHAGAGWLGNGFNQAPPSQILSAIQSNPAMAAYLQQILASQQITGPIGPSSGSNGLYDVGQQSA